MFSEKEKSTLRSLLQKWYRENRRLLPWRGDIVDGNPSPPVTPYGILVSEIMLQQTRVETVISYWNRWMNTFPNIKTLALASQEEINAHWSGLGYYRRAKALSDCAKILVEKHDGMIPNDHETLLSLPGIGPYTAGAISSIAFNIPQSAVDGNVIRVFSRLRALDEEGTQLEKLCRVIALDVVDPDTPSVFNQALMELGATICKPTNPSCEACPIRELCIANRMVTQASEDIESLESSQFPKSVTDYPRKVPKKPPVDLKFIIIAVHRASHPSSYLFSRRPPSGLLANQWEFPCVKISMELDPGPDDWKGALETVNRLLGVSEENGIQILRTHDAPILHIFSHQRHHMYLLEASLPEHISSVLNEESLQWMSQEELREKGITTGVKKIFSQLKKDSIKKSSTSVRGSEGTGEKKRRERGIQQTLIVENLKRTKSSS